MALENNTYAIDLSAAARKALKKINKPDVIKIIEKIKLLATSRTNLDIKKLEKHKNLYRLRCGNYRIVYEPLHHEIVIYVVLIGARATVYKDLEKLIK